MQEACMSPGTLQFDKTDPRCLPLYQAGNGVSDNWKVMSLAQGHLKVLLAIWNENTEWWMICVVKITFQMILGKKKYEQKHNQRQQEYLEQMRSQVDKYRMENPGLPLLGWATLDMSQLFISWPIQGAKVHWPNCRYC